MLGKRKIKLYQGFDPTGTRLHLGHAIGLRKLMEFADVGHDVTCLFGTGTVLVGDPSLRDSVRTTITEQEIEKNLKDWKAQAGKIVDFNKATIKKNGDWLTKLTLKEVIEIASQVSAIQLFKRDSFQRRLDKGDTVWYHETMYPLLQGYDSVVLDADLEIGGTDQEFNMLIGRELMKKMKNKEKYVLTTPMILGTDGKPMSKTSGNCVWLDDSAEDMFGKLMRVPDDQIMNYFNLCTDVEDEELEELHKELQATKNPRDLKARMAQEVVKIYHDESTARESAVQFDSQFKDGNIPDDIPELKLKKTKWDLAELLVKGELVSSKSAAHRVIDQGGVKVNSQAVGDEEAVVKSGDIIQVGKRKFRRISLGR